MEQLLWNLVTLFKMKRKVSMVSIISDSVSQMSILIGNLIDTVNMGGQERGNAFVEKKDVNNNKSYKTNESSVSGQL